jgi:hypothetical protein
MNATIGKEQTLPTVPDIVRYLHSLGAKGATVKFVRRILRNGELPGDRIGHVYTTSKEAVDLYLANKLSKRRRGCPTVGCGGINRRSRCKRGG